MAECEQKTHVCKYNIDKYYKNILKIECFFFCSLKKM